MIEQNNNLTLFTFNNNDIRLVVIDNQPWFVAKDIAGILDYSETSVMLRRLDDMDTRKIAPTLIAGTNEMSRELTVISEFGLYEAILGSKKTEAKEFKKWITHKILPTIRKTGGYVSDDDLFIKTYLPHADDTTKLLFKQMLQNVKDVNRQLTEAKPKIDFYEAVTTSSNSIEIGTYAKILYEDRVAVGRNRLFAWLRNNGYLRSNKEPYQKYLDRGFFEVQERVYSTDHGNRTYTVTMITGVGQVHLASKVRAYFGTIDNPNDVDEEYKLMEEYDREI